MIVAFTIESQNSNAQKTRKRDNRVEIEVSALQLKEIHLIEIELIFGKEILRIM